MYIIQVNGIGKLRKNVDFHSELKNKFCTKYIIQSNTRETKFKNESAVIRIFKAFPFFSFISNNVSRNAQHISSRNLIVVLFPSSKL